MPAKLFASGSSSRARPAPTSVHQNGKLGKEATADFRCIAKQRRSGVMVKEIPSWRGA